MTEQGKLHSYVEGAMMAGLAAIIALIGFYIPPFQALTIFVWLTPIIVVAARRGFHTAVLAMLTTAILLMILASPWRAFLYLVQFFGFGILMAYYMSIRADFSRVIVTGTFVAAISSLVSILLSLWVMNFTLADFAASFQETAEGVYQTYQNLGLLDTLESQGMGREEFMQQLQVVSQVVIKLIPASLIVYGMTVVSGTFLISRKVMQYLRIPVGDMPAFRHWQIPWKYTWGIIIALLALLLGDYMDLEGATLVGMNILYVYAPVMLVQGLAVAVYYYHRWKLSLLIKIALAALVMFNLPVAFMMLLMIGVFDPLFDYRRIGRKAEPKTNEKNKE